MKQEGSRKSPLIKRRCKPRLSVSAFVLALLIFFPGQHRRIVCHFIRREQIYIKERPRYLSETHSTHA